MSFDNYILFTLRPVNYVVRKLLLILSTEHGNIVLQQGLREIFVLKREGVAG
jgi:hypothetical protein